MIEHIGQSATSGLMSFVLGKPRLLTFAELEAASAPQP